MKKIYLLILLLGLSSTTFTQHSNNAWLDTVKFSPIDNGKMWIFDFPPKEYLKSTYDFSPSDEWFEKARLSAIRLPGCSASLISEDGLIMTNHHCSRGSISKVTQEGEQLIITGFYATKLSDERKISNYYVDQLQLIEDITQEILNAFNSGKDEREKVSLRAKKISEIEKDYSEKTGLVCNVISFYNGGKYSIYGYKRFTDIRLVFAPESAVASYGGDPDNFTFPRYDLDVAFMRIYENEQPYKSAHYFSWSKVDVKENEEIFVIGHPGRTNRHNTISQLEFNKDISLPINLSFLSMQIDLYNGLIKKYPEKKHQYVNSLYGFENSRKVAAGILNSLFDNYLMAKKRDFERYLKTEVANNKELSTNYASIWDNIEQLQTEKAKLYGKLDAYNFRTNGKSKIFSFAYELVDLAYKSRLPEDNRPTELKDASIDSVKASFKPVEFDPEVETSILTYQLNVLKKELSNTPELNKFFGNKSISELTKEIIENKILTDPKEIQELLRGDCEKIFSSNDPVLSFLVNTYQQANSIRTSYISLIQKEEANLQLLGNLIYKLFGNSIPPDGNSTLRISDGIVKGFEYNGTIAPPITTFYGMYDRHYSFNATDPWKLPDKWLKPPKDFDLSTPMNFVSTCDSYGGNSGSPAVNKNLEIIGLNFDRNIDGMSRNFIYTSEKGRNVMVHSAGIMEALQNMYNADRIVKELKSGKRTK
jgi:hypothetical protein